MTFVRDVRSLLMVRVKVPRASNAYRSLTTVGRETECKWLPRGLNQDSNEGMELIPRHARLSPLIESFHVVRTAATTATAILKR